jgi:hypothetical protein
MELDDRRDIEIVQQYFGLSSPLPRHGGGISGFVYQSPDRASAVKVHSREESFAQEVEAYQRLRRLRLVSLHGLNIPRLLDVQKDTRLIAMEFVLAPFLLDFAGVLFKPPDFPPDTLTAWHHSIHKRYGPNAWVAYLVYESLARHGIFYLDFRKSNMLLDGLPGTVPFDENTDDDFAY